MLKRLERNYIISLGKSAEKNRINGLFYKLTKRDKRLFTFAEKHSNNKIRFLINSGIKKYGKDFFYLCMGAKCEDCECCEEYKTVYVQNIPFGQKIK